MGFSVFRRLGCRLLLGAYAFLVTATAAASPVNCGERPIHLAFYDHGFLFDKGKGIDKDIVDELVRRSGCKFDLQVMTRARIWADLASGTLDMSVSGIQNAERDRFAWFVNYLSMKNYALVHTGAAATIQRAEDFLAQRPLYFGVVRAFKHGSAQDQWLEQLRAQQRVQESPDAETVFRKLKERRIDAMYSQPPVYRKYLLDLGMDKDVVVEDWTPQEKGVPHGLILAKSRFSEADAAQWRVLVQDMRTDGTLKRIYLRYLPAAEAAKLLDF